MKVVFLLAADMDVQAAYEYLDLVNEGLGDRFLAELEAGTRQISAFPLSCRLHLDDYRRLVMPRFPYGVFYVIESDRIVIHAIMDLRQSTETIRRRLLGPRGAF